MAVFARQAVGFHPAFNPFKLCRVVTIMPVNARQNMSGAVRGKVRRDDIIKAKPLCDRVDI